VQPIWNQLWVGYSYFPDLWLLFKLPCFLLVVGLLFIDWFISRTNAKIAAEKAAREAEAKKAK
jgi:cytochrome c-type biogenesis protein CcmH/NrfF